MGIYDRDHRQNDPWKKNQQHNESYKYNESKGEMEIDNAREFNQSASARRKLKKFKRTWKLEEEKKPKNFLALFFWGFGLLSILVISKEVQKHHSSTALSSTVPTAISSSSSFDSIQELAPPPTSVLSTAYIPESANCPFTLIADNKNYYIKLCDMLRGGKTVAKFFVRAGEELKTTIPTGNYKIKFGSGDEWYGEEELFGEYSQYGESENLNFSYDGYASQGHTISFYQQVNGNLHTSDIGRDAVLQN